jgi:Xaa-Pro aminopeptidase
MTKAGLPGLLVTHLPDLRYLSGFTGSSAVLAIAGRTARFFTDGRYASQAAAEVTAVPVEVVGKSLSASAVEWLAAQRSVEYAGFDPARTTIADLTKWKAALPSGKRRGFFSPLAAPMIEPLRLVKDEDELALMSEAALLGCRLFEHILGFIGPGLKEIEVAAELEYRARLLGAEGMSFETIVASGARSALPHGKASTGLLPRRGFLTMDFGVVLNGYCSDMTRTVFLGRPKADERNVYEAVLEAQQKAVGAVAAGASCEEVDEAARGVLREAELAENFTHSTGHGVGLEIHEPPRLGVGEKSRLLDGMVVTVEPGVYLPGQFGIRIEDMVAVTGKGCRILTPAPKALIEL